MSSIKLNSKRSVEALSGIFFLLLFPGFFFYYQGIASGVTPKFLGGFFLPVCLIALVGFSPFWKYLAKRCQSDTKYFIFFVALLFVVNVSAVSSYLLYPKDYMWEALIQHFSVMLAWVAFFLVGLGLNVQVKSLQIASLLFWCLILFNLFYYVFESGSFQYIAARYHNIESDIATHQAYARSFFVLSFFILAFLKSEKKRTIVFLASVAILFILSARSEFSAVIITLFSFYFLRSWGEKKKLLVIAVVFVALSAVFINNSDVFFESRHSSLVSLDQDQSWSARKNLFSQSWNRIKSSPFFGIFGGHFESGGAGSYAHNIISAWDAYGVMPFFLYLYLAIVPFVYFSRKVLLSVTLSPTENLAFYISFSSLILLLVAKTVFWPLPALAWGLYLSNNQGAKNEL